MSLNDRTPEARRSKLIFDRCRKAVLRMSFWKFATKRVTLAPLASPPEFGWTYQFNVPGDYIRLKRVHEIDADLFDMEDRKILAHTDTLKISYVYDQTDLTKADSLFVEALSTYLARELAYPLGVDKSLKEEIAVDFKRIILPLARFVDSAEGGLKTFDDFSLIDARFDAPTRGFVRDPGT